MRVIKFEYIWKKGETIVKQVCSLDDIESLAPPLMHRKTMPLLCRRQFTGLKDKNGNDIYEGDIVRAFNMNWKVVFEQSAAMFIYESIENEMHYEGMDEFENDCLIIGNTYENPELLNE